MNDLELREIAFGSIGERLGDGIGWVDFHVYFHDVVLDATPSLEIRVPIFYEEHESIESVRERAYRRAIDCLQIAVAGMKSSPIRPS